MNVLDMKSDFPNLFVLGNPKYKLLVENMDIVINDLREAGCITEIWINDLIYAFEASGYKVVRDNSMPEYVIGNPPKRKK